jgi:hypothetical protein
VQLVRDRRTRAIGGLRRRCKNPHSQTEYDSYCLRDDSHLYSHFVCPSDIENSHTLHHRVKKSDRSFGPAVHAPDRRTRRNSSNSRRWTETNCSTGRWGRTIRAAGRTPPKLDRCGKPARKIDFPRPPTAMMSGK